MVAALDAHVVGQPHAKRALAVAVYNHYARVRAAGEVEGVEGPAPRAVLGRDLCVRHACCRALLGSAVPTACGKSSHWAFAPPSPALTRAPRSSP